MAATSFHDVYKSIKDRTIAPIGHLRTLFMAAHMTRKLPGVAAEMGAYRGGSAALLAQVLSEKRVHVFDTFSGIPEGEGVSGGVHTGAMAADEKDVRNYLAPYPNIEIHAGFFPKTFAGLEKERFSLAHFDGDTYQSCKDFISIFWPRMVERGVLVFHDYDCPTLPGVKRAIKEAGLYAIVADHSWPDGAFVIKWRAPPVA